MAPSTRAIPVNVTSHDREEGVHAGSGQDRSWLAQFQSGKLLLIRRNSVCALVGKEARILRMSLHSSSDVPAAITWKSGFCMRSLHIRLPASQHLREIICLSFRRCGLHRRRPAHRCTTRVSVGCAPKWTAVPLSRHAAVSQADMDETETTPPSIPVSKCDIEISSRSRSQS